MKHIQYLLYISFALYVLSFISVVIKRSRISSITLASGLVIHTIFLMARGWAAGIFIPGAIFHGVFLMPWAMAVCVFLIEISRSDEMSSRPGFIVMFFFMAASMFYPSEIAMPMPNKITAWSYSFFFTEVCAEACFIVGGGYALNALRRRSVSRLVDKLLSWGFVLYTVAQIVGAIWAFLGWGTTFRWGTKHLLSAVIWIYYANYLHLRYMPDRSGKDRLWYAVIGLILVTYCIFSYYFSSIIFSGTGS